MDASSSVSHPAHDPHQQDAHDHHELPFWKKYIISTDHKVIGIQYGITGLIFLFFGFCLMMLMRWQLAYPGKALPVIGNIIERMLGPGSMTNGVMTPEFYNSLGAMHGTIMIFLGIVPIAFAAFGNFVVPLQIGAPDMTFPKINMASYQAFFVGGVVMLISFFVPGGAAKGGWTSYTPLSDISDTGPNYDLIFNGQTLWLIGFILLITSSLLGAVNFIATIIQLRAKGMTWMRLPFFVWSQFVTAFLLLLAFPPLESAIVMQLMDRVAGTSFFLPSGLVLNGTPLSVSGGGSISSGGLFSATNPGGPFTVTGCHFAGGCWHVAASDGATSAVVASDVAVVIGTRGRVHIGSRDDRWYHRACQLLAQLDAPLVEWVGVPDDALHEDLVLVTRNEPAERARRQARKQEQADRTVAGVRLVCREPRQLRLAHSRGGKLRTHLLGRLAECKRLGLRQAVRECEIVLLLKSARCIDWRQQIERDPGGGIKMNRGDVARARRARLAGKNFHALDAA